MMYFSSGQAVATGEKCPVTAMASSPARTSIDLKWCSCTAYRHQPCAPLAELTLQNRVLGNIPAPWCVAWLLQEMANLMCNGRVQQCKYWKTLLNPFGTSFVDANMTEGRSAPRPPKKQLMRRGPSALSVAWMPSALVDSRGSWPSLPIGRGYGSRKQSLEQSLPLSACKWE